MEDAVSSKRRPNEEPSMWTPPTPRVHSFSRGSGSTEPPDALPQGLTHSASLSTRVTPPSTASPLKYPRDSTSSEGERLNHDGITSFATADPPVADLLAAPASSPYPRHRHRRSSTPSPRPISHHSQCSDYENNTIVNTIRELGYRKYLQTLTLPQFLPARLRATPVTPQPAAPAPRTPQHKTKNNKKKPTLGTSRSAAKPSKTVALPQSKKRKLSEVEPSPRPKVVPPKARKSEDAVSVKTRETPPKRAKTAPPATLPPTSSPAKLKNRKTPKKASNTGAGKAEKSRTKEQRWGDYLKNIARGEKDVYWRFPDLAVPPLGHLIDQVPVRPYTFNKGKVQDYGDGEGLHTREMELAREVGLSYNAYRQQKRMAFIGYAAMQLEGKNEFKKSHTQSMCNIDGNKATHLWIHFHDGWGWMPENPSPPITVASLGDLQLPDLQAIQPLQ